MKLKQVFKAIGLALFLVALILFLYLQNPKVSSTADRLAIAMVAIFGCILAISCACLVTSELIGRIDTLEQKVFWLEEELKKMKKNSD